MRYQAIQDDKFIVEVYEQLLLETPATNANIERFIKKYLSREIDINLATARDMHNPPLGPGGFFDEKKALHDIKNMYRGNVMFELEAWTPGVQQALRANGGISDIFGYPDISAMRQARNSVSVSKTAAKKAYKKAEGMEKIYETDQFVFFKPENWEASRKFFGMPERISLLDGKLKPGAKWCTASSDPKHFNAYARKKID